MRTRGYGLLIIARYYNKENSWREFWTTESLVPSLCKHWSGMQSEVLRAHDWRVQNSCITSVHGLRWWADLSSHMCQNSLINSAVLHILAAFTRTGRLSPIATLISNMVTDRICAALSLLGAAIQNSRGQVSALLDRYM